MFLLLVSAVKPHPVEAWLEELSLCVSFLVTVASLCGSPVRLLDWYSVHKH